MHEEVLALDKTKALRKSRTTQTHRTNSHRPHTDKWSYEAGAVTDEQYIYSCVMAKRRKPEKRKIYVWTNTDFDKIRQEVDNVVTNLMDQHSNESSVDEMWMEIKNHI